MKDLERASESIANLEAIIGRLNEGSFGVDHPNGAPDISNQVGHGGVSVDITTTARSAVDFLLNALATTDGQINNSISSGPPEWWRNLRAMLGGQRSEYTDCHPTFLDAFEILDRHVSEDHPTIGGLVFLKERLDHKIVRSGAGMGLRPLGHPNMNRISFAFDPELDREIYEPLRELLCDVPVLPKECVAFLRGALTEACNIAD